MRYHVAQDTFYAGLEDGGERLVVKGEPLPESHELVKRDLAACKADKDRTPLFRLLDEDQPPPAKPRRSSAKSELS